MNTLISILLVLHIAGGTLTLIAGFLALISVKGSPRHILAGKTFFYSMMVTVIAAFIIAVNPATKDYFLAAIAVFSAYFIISGFRIYSIKNVPDMKGRMSDKFISFSMILVSIGMILFGITLLNEGEGMGWVLILFGGIGLLNAVRDVIYFIKGFKSTNDLVRLHIIRMVAGYIAAWTAFIVVNKLLPGLYAWITPTVVGSVFITYMIRKYKDLTID